MGRSKTFSWAPAEAAPDCPAPGARLAYGSGHPTGISQGTHHVHTPSKHTPWERTTYILGGVLGVSIAEENNQVAF